MMLAGAAFSVSDSFTKSFSPPDKMRTGPGNKILVIEHDDETRGLLCGFIENLGFQVTGNENANDALEMALSELPDLIYFDLSDNKSLEVIYKIRQRRELTAIPILTSSGDGSRGIELYSNIDNLGNALIVYITKPINFDALREEFEMIFPNRKRAA